MSETIRWPNGEFTIQEAIEANPGVSEAVVRRELSAAMAAKAIIQTQKGNQSIRGKFQLVKAAT